MRGLMQDYPLTLPHIFRRAERLFREKGVVTATAVAGGDSGPVRERVRSSLIEEEAAKWLVEHAKGLEPTEPAQDEAGSAASDQKPESPAPESQEQQQ